MRNKTSLMLGKLIYKLSIIGCISYIYTTCIPQISKRNPRKAVPESYNTTVPDSNTNSAKIRWNDFFTDPNLTVLIDTALQNNQQLNIVLRDIIIANNQVRARKGQYLPFLGLFAGASVDKVGKYTSIGSIENNSNIFIRPGQQVPEVIPDYLLAANVSWQVDIWKQLRNARKAAVYAYLSSIEGKNYVITLLIADIASNYNELMALDNQIEILKANIAIQTNALDIVKLQKLAGIVTELAVRRFEGEVNKNQARLYYYQQRIVETENRINYLLGRFPRPIPRSSQTFINNLPTTLSTGIPSQLLQNRPDIRQAERDLEAANLNVKVAKAYFYPALNITASAGYEAFNPKYLITSAQSTFYSLAGGLAAPLVNRNGIKADYYAANARQIQAAYNYERTILNAYTEVVNQQSNIANLGKSFDYKSRQVEALTRSINISISLFKSAMADYVEVLLTQRDALESKIELVETKKQQMNAVVRMYQVLGGGW